MKPEKTNEELQIEIDQLKAKIAEFENTEFKSSACLENSPVCTKVVDLDFNLQYMSNAGVSALQIDNVSAYYGKPYPLSFFPEAYKITMSENLLRVKQTGETIIQEGKILDVKGNALWFEATITPVRNKKGEIDHILVVSVDTSASKQAKDELLKSETKYRELVNRAQEGIWVLDKHNSTSFVNPSMAKMLGYSVDEMLGKSLFYFMDKTGVEIANYNLERRQAGIKDQHDFEFICKNGRQMIASLETAPIMDKDGNYDGAIAGIIDITKRKQAEEALRASEATIRNKLKAITEPEGDIGSLELSDIVDLEMLQSIMKDFHQLTGMAGAIVDITGKVLISVGWQDICTKFHRCNPQTSKNCIESDTILAHGVPEGTFKTYHCKNNMWDIVTPLMVGGKHLGNIFLGQYFLEDEMPDVELFRKQAIKYGFDEKEYLAAFDRVPRFTQRMVDIGMQFYSKLAGLISTLSFSTIQQSRLLAERKLAEERIRAAEENIKNSFDISPSIICNANLDTGYFIEANQAVTRILGYSIEEFVSKPTLEFIHPDDRQRTVDEILEQQKGKETAFFENRYLCKDGSYRWMDWHVTKPNKDGIVTAIASDISKRKIAQIQLIESEEKYRTIIETSNDLIWLLDHKGNITFINAEAEKATGYFSSDLKDKSFHPLVVEDELPLLNQVFAKTMAGERISYEMSLKTVFGNKLILAVNTAPLSIDGKVQGIFSFARDITEQKKVEDDVRRLSTAIEQSPVMIVITDTKGYLEYVNPKFVKITGYSSTEAIGQKTNILKSGEQDAAFYKEMWEIVDSGKIWRGQFHNKKKNGELFWEAASISAILNEAGEVTNFIKIGEDITQQKQTETELQKALEKALESERLKSAFLANMSHEIRTPMNGILGFLDLINQSNLRQSEINEYSDIIHKSSNRLLTTINDIIDISKIEAGEVLVTKRETYLNSELDELYSFHSAEANKKGLSLYSKPSLSSEQATILTDSNKLHGILTNLIKNAIKYTDKGSITFGYTLKNTEPVGTEQGKSVELEFFVEDTGIGIPENRIQAVFNRFEQADIADTRAFEGSGLGLAISKAYTEMLGGEIFVESEEGKGSKFTFTIPYLKKAEKEIEPLIETIDYDLAPIKHLNLLIVEDDIVSLKFLKRILSNLFQRITAAKNGREAVESCKNNPDIDLVLMDIKMPIMDGYEATQQIRTFNTDVVIIAQTAFSMPEDKEIALEVGCNDYITKPINRKLLFEMIYKHIR